MEIWDLYDANRTPLHQTHTRGTPVPKGFYHIVVEVWTVNNKGEVLLTLRSPTSVTYPNQWETTCGSVLAGETSLNGALRELNEETGIAAGAEQIHFVKTFCKNTSFVDVYLVCKDVAIQKIVLQSGETSAARWATFAEVKQMLAEGTMAFPKGKNPDEIYNMYTNICNLT
ncbi:MAG: NUDIX hydrolase [Oscillospiraceae bacterium]